MEERCLIRNATCDDAEFVISIMNEALSPYYDGDHTSHAKRILAAHLEGGVDKLGFFSFEQKMFIAEVNGQRAGLIHIVGKKQKTYKISPLIVLEKYRDHGVGRSLLAYIERYIYSKRSIRQIYCTVAETNATAKCFFERNGFIKAGFADSHYKIGVAEAMYYKPLNFSDVLHELEIGTVSVLELFEAPDYIKNDIRNILLDILPHIFDGIDDSWIDSLFSGYARRNTVEVNQKYKLIYVAIDNSGKLVGIAAATPKKGAPIKVMPLIALTKVAFVALLTDLPYQLLKYGRKLYVHITPSSEETKLLQLKGWTHDSDLPEAYHENVVTQQWSYEFKSDICRYIRVRAPFFQAIKNGQKSVEIRIGYATMLDIQVGDKINFITLIDSICVRITKISKFKSLSEMFEAESYLDIMPWANEMSAVKDTLCAFYPDEKIKKFGIIAFHFALDN